MAVPLMKLEEDERLNTVALVRRWGGLATDALLDPACQFFSIPQVEGLVGYRMQYGCAVVYGDPVCAPLDKPRLAQAFHDFYREQCKNIIYLVASESFAKWAIQHLCKALIEYGEEIYLDPSDNPTKKQGTHACLVRRKVRHAQRNGVSIHEYHPHDPQIEEALKQVGINWLQARRGAQAHISNIHLFADRLGKRWFYAKQGDDIVGVVVLNELHAHEGWHLNHLMFTPHAPNGVSEFLIISVLETLQREGYRFVSCGVTPAKQLGEFVGLSTFSEWMTRKGYQMADRLLHLGGHKMFWGKFFPKTCPSYLLFHHNHVGWREILAVLRALNILSSS